MLEFNLLPQITKSGSVSKLNEKWEKKKIGRSLRTNKDLEQKKEIINSFNKRSIRAPFGKDKKVKVKDIHSLEEKYDKKLKTIEDKIDVIGGDVKDIKMSMNNLFLLSIIIEDIPKKEEKQKRRNFFERYYKKLLPSLFKKSPANNNDEEDGKEISI